MMKTLGALLALLGYAGAVSFAIRAGIFQAIYASIFAGQQAAGNPLELVALWFAFLSALFHSFCAGGWFSLGFVISGIIGSTGVMMLLHERR